MELHDRVYHLVSAEKSPQDKLDFRGESVGEFELDMRDWGFTYGVAYGIARGEDPYEPEELVRDRAIEAARLAWQRWAGASSPSRKAVA